MTQESGQLSGTAPGYELNGWGFDSRQGLRIFFFTAESGPALGPTQPALQWAPRDLSLGVKRPKREADNSPPSNADIKNAWSYTPILQYAFMAWFSVKVRGQL
jgi:hypothetical protein